MLQLSLSQHKRKSSWIRNKNPTPPTGSDNNYYGTLPNISMSNIARNVEKKSQMKILINGWGVK